MSKLMSQSNLDCGFAVAACVGVMYDWGEHDNIKGLLISYKYLQHLHLDRRYVGTVVGAVISLRIGL
jgi:hypothetical protein